MAKTNVPNVYSEVTHEGARASRINVRQQLKRSLNACMLWEDTFYEDGISIAERIANLVGAVDPREVAMLAVQAREEMKLRHAPLWVIRAMANLDTHKPYVADTLERVIQRADELAEFVSLYWLIKRQPLSAQVKRGLARAFNKFDAYQFAKYNREGAIKLKDVMFLVHPKPRTRAEATLFKQIVDNNLPIPETWETQLSAGKDKKTVWEKLLSENKLGALALLRNLRNMKQVNVSRDLIKTALAKANYSRVLPFRFIAAARAAPEFEADIDAAMMKSLSQREKLPGKTVVIIDVSGSMYGQTVSAKSDMDRALAACALGAIAREMCENVSIYATAGSDFRRTHQTELVPARHGMALVDAIYKLCHPLGGGGIFLNQVCKYVTAQEGTADRTIVITDEQDCSDKGSDSPLNAVPLGKGYLINVNSYKNGIGYGRWTHIDGFSEAVLDYISEAEKE